MGLRIYSAWLSVICVQKTYWPCFPPPTHPPGPGRDTLGRRQGTLLL